MASAGRSAIDSVAAALGDPGGGRDQQRPADEDRRRQQRDAEHGEVTVPQAEQRKDERGEAQVLDAEAGNGCGSLAYPASIRGACATHSGRVARPVHGLGSAHQHPRRFTAWVSKRTRRW